MRCVMAMLSAEKEDWRRHDIFRTCVLCGGKSCNVILGGSDENLVSKEVVEKLKLHIEKHCKFATSTTLHGFRKGMRYAYFPFLS